LNQGLVNGRLSLRDHHNRESALTQSTAHAIYNSSVADGMDC
jgi:hypothetical protein